MQGGFVASPYDKTLPIQAHETWSGVLKLPCLGPGIKNQGPRSIHHPPSAYLRLLHVHRWRWLVLLGPWTVDQATHA